MTGVRIGVVTHESPGIYAGTHSTTEQVIVDLNGGGVRGDDLTTPNVRLCLTGARNGMVKLSLDEAQELAGLLTNATTRAAVLIAKAAEFEQEHADLRTVIGWTPPRTRQMITLRIRVQPAPTRQRHGRDIKIHHVVEARRSAIPDGDAVRVQATPTRRRNDDRDDRDEDRDRWRGRRGGMSAARQPSLDLAMLSQLR